MPSLGNDLASKRKSLKLSVEDVHQSTKLPVAILKSIEDDSIFSTLDENKTYIRSYIRSYARAVKIDDNQIIQALDQTEKGNYTGLPSLAIESEQADESKTGSAAAEKADSGQHTEDKADVHTADTPDSRDKSKSQKPDQIIPSPPEVSSVDWAGMGRKFTPLQSKSRLRIGLILLFLAIAATAFIVIYQSYYLSDGTDTRPVENSSINNKVDTPYADSLQLNLASPVKDTLSRAEISRTGMALKALPDTLNLTIYAAYGILEPVRVFTDVMDNVNPYWIEHREAYKFEFVNTIHIRGQYSRMELLFNGHPIKNFRQQFYNPETRMLEIHRSNFENDASWLQPPPDSLDIPAPPPLVIKDRPTFY